MRAVGDVWVMKKLALIVLTAAALSGCGSSGPSATAVTDALGDLYPAPNARDNTGLCAQAGCVQLITTDAVSVYQWPDAALARSWADRFPKEADQVGVFVLSYAGTEQQLTSAEARKAYAEKVAELTR